ncbi:NusA-like KH domain protein [Candidatus Tiddalikarchaeum anstoanum]|nr:NusA-like KH domain protein [Candidatus Tiddalikarchaeum anstoanum]
MISATFKLDTDAIKQIAFFESITHAKVSDCAEIEDKLLFIVGEGNIGKAIGKNGSNVKLLEQKFNKKVEIIEFNNDPAKFVANILRPVEVKSSEIVTNGSSNVLNVIINCTRAMFPSKKVKKAKLLLKKYFPQIGEVTITT